MNLNLDLNKAIKLYGLIILGFLLLLFAAKYFDALDYYKFDYETNETAIDSTAFMLSRFIWFLPMAGFWFVLSTLNEDKRPAFVALGLYVVTEIYFAYQNYNALGQSFFDYKNFLAYDYWKDFFIRALPYVAFVLMKYKNDRRFYFLILFPFFSWGIHFIWEPGFFVERMDDLLRGFDFRNGIGRYEPEGLSRRYMYLMLIYGTFYPVLFFVFTRLENYIQNPYKFKRDFNVIDPASLRLDKVSFSILFWCCRILIAVIIYSKLEGDNLTYMRETHTILIIKTIVCCGALYLFVVFYRNLLVQFCVETNNYPGWQFLGLNIPIINIFVWLAQISKTKQEIQVSFLDDDLEDEVVDIDQKNPNWTVQDLKANFLSKERNKTIIGLIVTLTLLSGIYMLYAASEGRSDGDGIVPSLLYIVVSLGIIMWYYLQSSGAFYISAFIAVVATAIFIMDIRMFSPFDIIPSMVNVVLFHALYHFHEYEITTGEDDIPNYADTDVEGGIGADLEKDHV